MLAVCASRGWKQSSNQWIVELMRTHLGTKHPKEHRYGKFLKFYWLFFMEDTRFFIEYWGKLFPGLQQRVWAGHCFEMCIALCLFSLRQISQQEPDLLGFPYLLRGKEILSSNPHHPARQGKGTSHCSTWELSLHSQEEELFRGNCVRILQNHILTKTMET